MTWNLKELYEAPFSYEEKALRLWAVVESKKKEKRERERKKLPPMVGPS